MKALKDLLKRVAVITQKGEGAASIDSVCIDSREAKAQSLFVAIKGTQADGHLYINQALAQGAVVVVCERMPDVLNEKATYILVKDSAEATGKIAANFYGMPSAKMTVVGVTGTNGKTTTATLLFQLFRKLGYSSGLLSTVQNQINETVLPATHTTPDPVSLQDMLAKMANEGCTHVFMEVSSHAIHQKRIAGIHFAGGVFTNITHDHLDYHKTFEEYIKVKKSFFDGLEPSAFALTNIDDRRGAVMLQNTTASVNSYSLKSASTFKGKVIENNLTGLVMNIDGIEAHYRLTGTFNAYNLLAVYSAAVLLGQAKEEVISVLSGLKGAAGRFETHLSGKDKILGIIDYAHTPDALLNVLATINQLRTGGQRLITVVGCGGDRDKTKRPLMGEAAAEHSDKVIFTSDNPRSEDPEEIIHEMMQGLKSAQVRKSIKISDRKEAIYAACSLAYKGDVVLIAGKGHETYQEIKGVKHHFDDKEILEEAFKTLDK